MAVKARYQKSIAWIRLKDWNFPLSDINGMEKSARVGEEVIEWAESVGEGREQKNSWG